MIELAKELDFMQWLLVCGLGLFVVLLLYCQMLRDRFDLRHLITSKETDKVEREAFVFIGGWIIASWAFIYYASNLKLTELWVGLYMGLCIAPKLVAQFINAKFGGNTTTVSTSSSTEITQEKTS